MSAEFTPPNLEDFFVRDEETVVERLGEFAAAGSGKINYLFDYDRTLTRNGHADNAPTSWHIMHNVLPPEGRAVDGILNDRYQAMEDDGQLRECDAIAWWNGSLALQVEHGTTLDTLKERSLQEIHLREGASSLFGACEQAGITTTILSAGIKDIIEWTAEENDIHPTLVVATKLHFDEQTGEIVGWDEDTMVHYHNKQERGQRALALIRELRPFTLLIGDSEADPQMVSDVPKGQEGDVLRIRMSDLAENKSTSLTPDYVRRSFEAGYDMVTGDNLHSIVKLTRWMMRQNVSREDSAS